MFRFVEARACSPMRALRNLLRDPALHLCDSQQGAPRYTYCNPERQYGLARPSVNHTRVSTLSSFLDFFVFHSLGLRSNQVVRLVLVGSCDTGKTCLLRRFLGGYFDEAGQQDYTRREHIVLLYFLPVDR